MALSNHTFCWNGIVSSSPARTLAFFPEVLGWKTPTIDMGGETVTMFARGDVPLAHVRAPQAEGEPSWWNNYFRVDDVDAVTASVKANGGRVVVPPNDIAPGRFSTVATPSGAMMSLYHEANPEETDKPSTTGFVHWVDLHSTDLAADLAFIHEGLGLKTSQMDMPNGAYHLLEPEGATRGGAMAGMNPKAPSAWLAWIAVDDVDRTLERVTGNGGTIVAPAWDADSIGRMAIASDPVGVTFGIITPPAP